MFNIIDQRKSENETFCDVVLEIDNGDWKSFGLHNDIGNMTEWMNKTSIYDAVLTACGFKGRVTMYLYSPGDVGDNCNKLVIIHPGLKEEPITKSLISPEVYSPF